MRLGALGWSHFQGVVNFWNDALTRLTTCNVTKMGENKNKKGEWKVGAKGIGISMTRIVACTVLIWPALE